LLRREGSRQQDKPQQGKCRKTKTVSFLHCTPLSKKYDNQQERWIADLSVPLNGNAQNVVGVRFWPKADTPVTDGRGSFRE
jgi:hypothetical protein